MDSSDIPTEEMLPHENLGSPLVVQMLSRDFINLNIPQTSTSSHNGQPDVVYDSSNYDYCSLQENTEIIIVENEPPREAATKLRKDKKLKKKKSQSMKPKLNKTIGIIKDKNNSIIHTRKEDEEINFSDASTVINESTSLKINYMVPRFYSVNNKVVSIMEKHCEFCFTGKLTLKVLHGGIKVYGAFVTNVHPPVDIYSPYTDSHVVIENSNETFEFIQSNIQASLSAEGIELNTASNLKDDIENLQPGTTIIILTNLENNLTRFLNSYHSNKLFPKLRNNNYHSWMDLKRAELVLQSNLHVGYRECKWLKVPPNLIDNLVEEILHLWSSDKRSCTLVAGGKSVGKSTMCRFLINKLLNTTKRVILVDLDPGQTECGPAACISYYLIEEPLLGPNFTHIKSPVHQLYIGDVNVTNCFTRYMESIKLLIETLFQSQESKTVPIIINTMGFCSGIGTNIIHFISKLAQPTMLLQITSKKTKNNFSISLSKEVINSMEWNLSFWKNYIERKLKPCRHELHVMSSQNESVKSFGERECKLEPNQRRDLMMISYLSGIVESHNNYPFDDPTLVPSINQVIPYVAPFSSIFVFLISPFVPPKHILSVMNGNIVALCGVNVDDHERNNIIDDSYPRVLHKTSLCTCYGFGIIRGIDMEQKQIYINTPLSVTVMQFVNCLAGSIPVPQPLLEWNEGRAPYMSGNNNLPTSRATHRGYFRISNNQS